jgi:hypothetical protein
VAPLEAAAGALGRLVRKRVCRRTRLKNCGAGASIPAANRGPRAAPPEGRRGRARSVRCALERGRAIDAARIIEEQRAGLCQRVQHSVF